MLILTLIKTYKLCLFNSKVHAILFIKSIILIIIEPNQMVQLFELRTGHYISLVMTLPFVLKNRVELPKQSIFMSTMMNRAVLICIQSSNLRHLDNFETLAISSLLLSSRLQQSGSNHLTQCPLLQGISSSYAHLTVLAFYYWKNKNNHPLR